MATLHVNCVYGDDHVRHLEDVLIPSLAEASKQTVQFNCINYDGTSDRTVLAGERHGVRVLNLDNTADVAIGFAEGHNTLFLARRPDRFFISINPDCIPQPGCIDALVARYRSAQDAAIVEGRQWPFEHPKEFDPVTLETPWASGAFQLIDAEFYRSIGGMDARYFLYLEDVDLSWQAWLRGLRVYYEPEAVVIHFSGSPFYRSDLVENEMYFSIRNFILISRKFFGFEGERKAMELARNHPDEKLVTLAMGDIAENFKDFGPSEYVGKEDPRVKILGFCCFHEMR